MNDFKRTTDKKVVVGLVLLFWLVVVFVIKSLDD